MASMWVVTLHSLFLYSDPPLPCHHTSYWLRLFSSQPFSPYKYSNILKTSHPSCLGTQLPVKNEVIYLGLILDQKLTWRPHITAKKTQINLKLRKMNWLIGRKSKLTIENKLLLTVRRLMSYIYGAPILDVSRSHTTTQHSR